MLQKEYIPKFLETLNPNGVAFPPLVAERWGNYPNAQNILNTDALFYKDPSINPIAKSNQFRKGVVADWAGEQTQYNPYFFTTFPFGGFNNAYDQTVYVKLMEGDTFLDDKRDVTLQDIEDASYEINPPAQLNTELINNLIIPYVAGVELNRYNTPKKREEMSDSFKDLKPPEGFIGYFDYLFSNRDKINEKRRNVRNRILNPRYVGEAVEALNSQGYQIPKIDVSPSEIQLETIRRYRDEIDRKSGVEMDTSWIYNYE